MKAEWVIEQHSLTDRLTDLLALYGLRSNGRGKTEAERAMPESTPTELSRVCEAYAFDCMTDEDAALVERIEADAFEHFGYSRDWKALRHPP